MAQMREQEIAVRLDRRQLDFIFDNKVQNVAVPIEIGSPDFLRYPIDALPCLVTELRLVPGAGRETWDAEIDASHFLWGPDLSHAGESAPGPLEPSRATIDDPDIGNPLEL